MDPQLPFDPKPDFFHDFLRDYPASLLGLLYSEQIQHNIEEFEGQSWYLDIPNPHGVLESPEFPKAITQLAKKRILMSICALPDFEKCVPVLQCAGSTC